MDLSIVFGGRDDNYGETFIERLEKALDYNYIKVRIIQRRIIQIRM